VYVCVTSYFTFSLYINWFKAAFHYSSQLQTWLQTWFSTRFASRFSTSSWGFATRFWPASGSFLSKTWSRTAACSLVRVRARQMECRKKTRFSSQLQAFDMLSTCLRPGLQLARIMECGLYSVNLIGKNIEASNTKLIKNARVWPNIFIQPGVLYLI